MRRWEERIADWLAGRRARVGPQSAWQLRKGLRPGLAAFPNAVKEKSLQLGAVTGGLDEALLFDSHVRDGLECLGQSHERSESGPGGPDLSAARTDSVDLLLAARVSPLKLPDAKAVGVRQEKLIAGPGCRAFSMDTLKSAVRAENCFAQAPPKVANGERLLLGKAEIGKLIPRIELFPHRRTSVEIGCLPDSERASFLKEAEALKGLRADRAELLAVFRHVPIEMVSRMRFLSGKRIILYTLSCGPRRTTTRVHDMAAVRDAASQEIHLVPHRTRFRSVSLN